MRRTHAQPGRSNERETHPIGQENDKCEPSSRFFWVIVVSPAPLPLLSRCLSPPCARAPAICGPERGSGCGMLSLSFTSPLCSPSGVPHSAAGGLRNWPVVGLPPADRPGVLATLQACNVACWQAGHLDMQIARLLPESPSRELVPSVRCLADRGLRDDRGRVRADSADGSLPKHPRLGLPINLTIRLPSDQAGRCRTSTGRRRTCDATHPNDIGRIGIPLYPTKGGYARVSRVVTLPDFQGMGRGTKLMEWCASHHKLMGAKRVSIGATHTRHRSATASGGRTCGGSTP